MHCYLMYIYIVLECAIYRQHLYNVLLNLLPYVVCGNAILAHTERETNNNLICQWYIIYEGSGEVLGKGQFVSRSNNVNDFSNLCKCMACTSNSLNQPPPVIESGEVIVNVVGCVRISTLTQTY